MPKISDLDLASVDAMREVVRIPAVENRATALEGRVGIVEDN